MLGGETMIWLDGLRIRAVCFRAGHLAIFALCWLALPVEGRAQFCPDAGTVYSTTDQTEGDAPITVRACDIDTDGDADLITANDASHTVSVLLNNGDGTYAAPLRWTTTTTPFDPICCEEPVDFDCCTEPVDVTCGDVNGDTYVDLISVNHTSDDVSVLLNDGSMQFAAPVRYPVGEAPFGIECFNVDGDTDLDLVTNGFTEDAISVLLNNGDGTFAPHVTYAAGDAPMALACCDVDGDSDDDVVTANLLSEDVSVLRNNGDGTFTNIGSADLCTTPTDCVNPFDIACCDFDGVNGPDVVTANGIADTVTVLFNDGAGGYGSLASYDNLDGAYAVTCGDLDGDADADVVSANLVSDDLAVFLNPGTGSFGTPSFLPVGSDPTANPSSVICRDVDGDLDTDLVTAFIDGVTVFENNCASCTEDGDCDDGVACTDDACVEQVCVYTPNDDNCPDDGVFCNGPEVCDPNQDCISAGDPCVGQGLLCDEETATCVECFSDADCDDGADCTIDTCDAIGYCQYEDTCPDDGLFCTGVEYCNVAANECTSTGDPCPPYCDEENDTCPCEPPIVEVVGSRYLAITPQGGSAMAFNVTSPDWTCLDKYVGGFFECGDTGKRCFTDANCNQCVGGPYGGPCLTDEDCKTCAVSHTPCQTNDDCSSGDTCVQVQTCEVSGNTCAPHLPLAEIDITYDGVPDGLVASLVDPQDALTLTPEEWGTTAYKRCSLSFAECVTDADCDVGTCSISGSPCSLAAPACRNVCTISQYECDNDAQCIEGAEDVCTVQQTCERYETCAAGKVYVTGPDILPGEGSHSTTYEVRAFCGALVEPPGAAEMWLWADTDDNEVVNMADVQQVVLGFKREYIIAIPPRTMVSIDLVGAVPCVPEQGISFDDVQQAVLAFKGSAYNPNVLDASDVCDVPCP